MTVDVGLVRREARRLVEWGVSEPWVILEPALEEMRAIAERLTDGPEAVAERLGRPLDNTRDVMVRDGVAVIPVIGPIVRRAGMFSEISGATSIAGLALDLRTALDDPAICAICLDVDSPGGEMTGTNELAKQIRAASAIKPVWAYVGGSAGSGGYWLASAAGRVIVDDTARLGSIGVIMSVRDDAPVDAPGRPKTYRFVSSQSPNKRPNLETEAGRTTVQATVDRLAQEFVAAVATYRGTTPEAVLERFGAGDSKIGSDAVAAGMADALGSLESVIAELAAIGRQPASTGRGTVPAAGHHAKGITMANSAPAAVPEITADSLRQSHPALVETFIAEGRKQGAAAELARVLGVQAQVLPGHEALVAAMVQDGTTTPEQAAVRVLQAERGLGATRLQGLKDTAAQVPPVPTEPAPAAPAAVDPALPVEQRCQELWNRDAKIRAEFHSLDAFTAYTKAEERGVVRLKRSA